jgi:Zn-dependent protease with chaperone function
LADLGLVTLVLIEWVVGFTYLSPLVLVGREWLYRRPNLGIFLWLGLFSISFLASVSAIAIALVSVFENWLALRQGVRGSDGWFELVFSSFAPWVVLAFGGILASLANQRIESLFALDERVDPGLLGGQAVGEISGFQIVELPVSFAYVGSSWKERAVIQTVGARNTLSAGELESCLQHEVAHLRFRHVQLLATATVLNRLLGAFAASKAMLTELTLLAELSADRSVDDSHALRSALFKLNPKRSRELSIRLEQAQFANASDRQD